jgi:hypothetical protein
MPLSDPLSPKGLQHLLLAPLFFKLRFTADFFLDNAQRLTEQQQALLLEIQKIREQQHYSRRFIKLMILAMSRCNLSSYIEIRTCHELFFIMIHILKEYPRQEYWPRTAREELIEHGKKIAHIPALKDFVDAYHQKSYLSFYDDGQRFDYLDDIWQSFLEQKFNGIRHEAIRTNSDYFLDSTLHEHKTDAGMSYSSWQISDASSFFGQPFVATAELNPYLLCKFTGHVTDGSRPLSTAQPPERINRHLGEHENLARVRQAYRLACHQFIEEDLMTDSYHFTEHAYQKPTDPNPVMVFYTPEDVKDTPIDTHITIGGIKEIYCVTPRTVYFLKLQQNPKYPQLILQDHTVCKDPYKIKKLLKKTGIKNKQQITNPRLLTPDEREFIQNYFGHLRYHPKLFSIYRAHTTQIASKHPEFSPYINFLPGIYMRADILTEMCFSNNTLSSFDGLRAITLMQYMTNQLLAANDLVASHAIRPDQCQHLKQHLNHTLDIATRRHQLFKQCYHQDQRIFYAYTAEINESFWTKMLPDAAGNQLFIRTDSSLFWAEHVAETASSQSLEKLAVNSGILAELDDCGLAACDHLNFEVAASNQRHTIYSLLLFNLASQTARRFVDRDDVQHIILLAGTPKKDKDAPSGHAFYVVLQKNEQACQVTIINGGTGKRRHTIYGDSPFEPGRNLYHAVSCCEFPLTEADDHDFLTQYMYATLSLKNQPCVVDHDPEQTRTNFKQAMGNIYFDNNQFHGLGDYTHPMPEKIETPAFYYPGQWTGNCTVHNLIHALVYSLGMGPTEELSRPLIDVLKRAVDLLITDVLHSWPLLVDADQEDTHEMLDYLEEEWESEAAAIDDAASPRRPSIFRHKFAATGRQLFYDALSM